MTWTGFVNKLAECVRDQHETAKAAAAARTPEEHAAVKMRQRDNIFKVMLAYSDDDVKPAAKERIAALVGRPNDDIKDDLLGILDDAKTGLMGAPEAAALLVVWQGIGGEMVELVGRANRLKRDVGGEFYRQCKAKYKWRR